MWFSLHSVTQSVTKCDRLRLPRSKRKREGREGEGERDRGELKTKNYSKKDSWGACLALQGFGYGLYP
jgi:hypothetical protein